MKKIRKINVCTRMLLENHNVNANEEGNNKEVNGKIAVSGQKIKYMLLNSINSINSNKNNTYVSNGDGATGDIKNDLRSDLGGYMRTIDKSYAMRRTSPIHTKYAVANNSSDFFDDLFVRFKQDVSTQSEDGKKHDEQRINTKTYSHKDFINFALSLECKHLSSTNYFTYTDGKHLSTISYKHVDEDERKRRAELFILATQYLEGWANQSRNAVENSPKDVFISFNTNSEHIDFFNLSDKQRENLLKKLDSNNVKYFIGSDDSDFSVDDAYKAAKQHLSTIDLDGSDYEVKTQNEIAEEERLKKEKAEQEKAKRKIKA